MRITSEKKMIFNNNEKKPLSSFYFSINFSNIEHMFVGKI